MPATRDGKMNVTEAAPAPMELVDQQEKQVKCVLYFLHSQMLFFFINFLKSGISYSSCVYSMW